MDSKTNERLREKILLRSYESGTFYTRQAYLPYNILQYQRHHMHLAEIMPKNAAASIIICWSKFITDILLERMWSALVLENLDGTDVYTTVAEQF